MISRSHRFHGLGSLRFVYKRGQTVRGQHLALKYIRNSRQNSFRCAVVVGKKVSKSAVVRNRIRRRLYEQLRVQLDGFDKPYDLVVTVFSDQVAEMPAQDLAKALNNLIAQVDRGIMK